MEKPVWRVRKSSYLVDSPYMRLRVDEVELPNGTVVPNYYVRESLGFVIAFPVTDDDRIVLVRQYRYGSDSIHLELPAGSLDAGEDTRDCVARELIEETGYEARSWEYVASYYAEPVRSPSRAHIFVGFGARKTREPQPDPTEILHVELATFDEFRAMIADGRIDAGHAVIAGYRALEYLGRL
jgi:8-oxo-dGTP pyrophosphatase MutT (NUDIX family)